MACDVLRELFKTIEVRLLCQLLFLISPESIVARHGSQKILFAQRKISKYRNGVQAAAEHLAPCSPSTCSGLGLESGRPEALIRDQTLGLRFNLSPLAYKGQGTKLLRLTKNTLHFTCVQAGHLSATS